MGKACTIALFILLSLRISAQQNKNGNTVLRNGWKMQSSLTISATGNDISQPSFKESAWNGVSLPTTIIAGLLKNKRYDFDPFYGNNLKKNAGPEFDSPWWFRKESIDFFVHLRALKKKGGDDILPVIFDDNYLLLAAGETRNIDCIYLNKDAGDAVPYVLTSAWNLDVNGSKREKNAGF